jgi:hypothetical protein
MRPMSFLNKNKGMYTKETNTIKREYIRHRSKLWLLAILLLIVTSISWVKRKFEQIFSQYAPSTTSTTTMFSFSDQKFKIDDDHSLSDQIAALEVGWGNDPPPPWLQVSEATVSINTVLTM